MSEFKFACPVCGQHITCDSAKSGTQLDCPTCFQKLIVPNAPQGDISKLILNASLARPKTLPVNGTAGKSITRLRPTADKFPIAIIGWVALFVALAFAAFGIRTTFSTRSPQPGTRTDARGAKTVDWKLNLAGVTIPDVPVSGRISGVDFSNPKVQFQDDTLNFRVGAKPPDLGLMIMFGKGIHEVAGRSFSFETNSEQAPRILLRWKNEVGASVRQYVFQGYALRLELNPVHANRLTGKIYFCATNAENSYAVGTFDAEILRPTPLPRRHPTQKRRQAR